MVRYLKHEVGKCKKCGSSAVFSISGKYADKKRHVSVVCSNPECRRHTSGYDTENDALNAWKQEN